MDKERRKELIEIYSACADDDLMNMIEEGEDSFQDGVFELILSEAKKRGFKINGDYEPDDETGHGFEGEINFDEVSTEDLMSMLVNIHSLDELNFHLAAAEAIRRNIDASDIRAFKKIVQCEQCSPASDSEEIEIIENPRPFIILKTIDEAAFYTDSLEEEGIPFEIQIIVDDKDYKKAEIITNSVLP